MSEVCSKCRRGPPEVEFHRNSSDFRRRTSRCKTCRSEDYYASRYPQTCACCTRHRPVQGNGQCRECNQEAGLRECRTCSEIKPLFLSFHGASRRCKDCLKKETT